jgi:hypothetical protein
MNGMSDAKVFEDVGHELAAKVGMDRFDDDAVLLLAALDEVGRSWTKNSICRRASALDLMGRTWTFRE